MVDSAGLADHRAGDADTHLAAALDAARAYCGWHLWPARTETLEVDPDGDTLFLSTGQLTEVASVTQGDEELLPADLRFTALGVVTRREGCWLSEPVEVEFTHGFVNMPNDLAGAIYALTSTRMAQRGGVVRVDIDQVLSETYSADQGSVDESALAPYVLPPV